jgi:hypothetical protein
MLFFRNRESKIGRNDPCPCGSGLKYKKCCMGKESLGSVNLKEKYYREYRIRLKEQADIEAIKAAGRIALATLELVEEKLKPGMATDEINTLVHEFTMRNGAVPAAELPGLSKERVRVCERGDMSRHTGKAGHSGGGYRECGCDPDPEGILRRREQDLFCRATRA